MAEHDGDGAGVEAGVDGVEDGSGHGDGEVELVHGRDIGGDDGDDLASVDAAIITRAIELRAATAEPPSMRQSLGKKWVF